MPQQLLSSKSSMLNKTFWLVVVFALAPFVLLSSFIHPHYDDYDFVNKIAGKNAFEATLYWYDTWSGRFSSIFVSNVLTYGTTNITLYRMYPIVLMSLYVLSFYIFFKTIFKNILSEKKIALLSLFFLILYIYKMPQVTTGFYYMICSYVSSTGTIAFLMLFAVLYKLLDDSIPKKGLHIFYGCLLAIYIGGSYEPLMAMVNTFMSLSCLLLIYHKNKNLKWFILIEAVVLISSVVSVLGPGNKIRGGDTVLTSAEVSLVHAFAGCAQYAFQMIIQTIQNPLLLLSLLFFIPFAKKLYETNSVIRTILNIHPLLIILGVYIIISVSYFPSMWVGDAPDRVLNQIYLFTVFSLFLITQSIVNYFLQKGIQTGNTNYSVLLKVLMIICLIPSLTNKNIGRAYSDLFLKASVYNKKMNERYEYIKQEKAKGAKIIRIPALFDDYKKYPLTIYYNYQELDGNSNGNVNKIYAKYWGVDSVKMINKESIDLLKITRTN
jgi:hypothetical protein